MACAWGGVARERLRTGGVEPEEGYEYKLDAMANRWVCEKGSWFVTPGERQLVLVRSSEDPGFTAYDAKDVRFKLEDGLAMWMTTDKCALEPGWHAWKYNECREKGFTWSNWSGNERFFEPTITGWTVVTKKPGIYGRPGTCRSGAGKKMKRSGASGGSGAGKKGAKDWFCKNRRRSWKESGKDRPRGW